MAILQHCSTPKVTAKEGTPEWVEQVLAYELWLDRCYSTAPVEFEVPDEVEDELDFYDHHHKL